MAKKRIWRGWSRFFRTRYQRPTGKRVQSRTPAVVEKRPEGKKFGLTQGNGSMTAIIAAVQVRKSTGALIGVCKNNPFQGKALFSKSPRDQNCPRGKARKVHKPHLWSRFSLPRLHSMFLNRDPEAERKESERRCSAGAFCEDKNKGHGTAAASSEAALQGSISTKAQE